MTFRTATTTAVGVAFFATVCAAASVDEVNKRFMTGTVSDQVADAGILIHQFGTTDNSYPGPNMWEPCDIAAGTCWFDVPGLGKFDDRVSCSITSNDAPKTTASKPSPSLHNVPPAGGIGLFSYDKGGVVLNPNAVNMTCSYPGDGGTMTRVPDARGGGCGCHNQIQSQWSPECIEPQINMTGGCDNSCPTPQAPAGAPWLGCHRCAWDGDKLSNMMNAQRAGTSAGPYIYNEILIQAAPWRANPSAFIDAFFYPKGSDPGSEAGLTKTVAAYKAFKAAYPQSDAPLLTIDATYPLSPSGNGPFAVAPESA